MTASFLDRLKAEIDKLEEAQTKLEQGEIMDFEEIKGRVAALCEDITNSPPPPKMCKNLKRLSIKWGTLSPFLIPSPSS